MTNQRLIILFDGTRNDPKAQTNVYQIMRLLRNYDGDVRKKVFCEQSADTSKWDHFRARGGIFSYGFSKNLRQGYEWLAKRYADGDEIWVFGFSRGAYTARSFAGLIRKCGLLHVVTPGLLDKAENIFRHKELSPDNKVCVDFRNNYSHQPKIHFIEVWNTSGALKISGTLLSEKGAYTWHDTKLSRIVEHAYHAIALDEHKAANDEALWTSINSEKKPDNIGVEIHGFAGVPCSTGPRLKILNQTLNVSFKFDKSIGIASMDKPNYAIVKTFFATDRNLTGKTKPDEMFGSNRSNIAYGTCDVSIPRDHRTGELESPLIWRLEFREDPAKHVVLLDTVIYAKDKFFSNVTAHIRQSPKKNAFVFVHGYNVTFEDAARRTAQITYDLGFDGAPVFYSWPSQGNIPSYTVDEQNIEWAQTDLRSFLDDFFTYSEAQNIYLIAHSMGNRALTRAVASLLTDKPALRNRLKEVILAAPDIDADVFKRDIAPELTAAGRSVTLYASSEDRAIAFSKTIHGYPRAGDSGQGLVVVPGIETIDATHVDTSLLGHSYYAEERSILSDMFNLICNDQRPDQRFGLRPVDAQIGRYWEFKP